MRLDHEIPTIDDKLIETVKGDKKARRLMTIPRVAGDRECRRRDGWRGLVLCERARVRRLSRPRATPRSSGGKERLVRITKMVTDICASVLVVFATTVLHHAT